MSADHYSENESPALARGFFGVFRYSRRAIALVWTTSRPLTVALAALTLVAGALPAVVAFVGARIVDSVVAAMRLHGETGDADYGAVLGYVALEAAVVAGIAATQRGISLCQSLLRAQLGQRVNVMILEKALTLELEQFEDSEFYDKLTRARREASSRPLSLVMRTFGLAQNGVSLVSYAGLLVQFSPWAVVVLMLAGLPAFVAEAKFSGDAFRLFRWRSPETRLQTYFEMVLAREDHAKEVKLFDLGPLFLERYREIFERLYGADRNLTIRRESWGFAMGLAATAALYGGYALDRGRDGAGRHHARPDDHVPDAVPPGAVGGVGGPLGGRRHVRGQSLPLDALRVPRAARARRGAAPWCGAPTRGRRSLRERELRYPGVEHAGAPGRLAPRPARQEPGPRRRERLRQDDLDQAADAALPAQLGAHLPRRPRAERLGRKRRCAGASG